MSGTPSQSFRANSSPKIVTIPAFRDPKTGKDVVRWKDIQQCFLKANYITNGKDMVRFMANEDLEDLIPLRIPHYPDIVLEVVTLDDHQRGGSSVTNDSELDLSPRNGSRMSGSQVSTAGSNGDTSSMDGDMEARRIAEMDDHQTPNGGRFERLLQEMDSTMALQEQLRQLGLQTRHIQGQLNDAQQRVQQTEQYLQNTQQQTQRLQDLQRTIDDALQNIQLSDQQTYESRRKIQNSIQRLQSVIEDAVQKTQQARQQAHEIIFYDKRDLSYVFVFLFICYTIYTILNYMVREDRFR